MLLRQTELMLAHLDRWIALDKNKGGRPGKTERDFVIGRLAEACIDITGRKPSQSKSGALVNLSAQVLEIMFGHSNGVETAVQRVMASGKRQGLFLRKTKSSKPT